MAHKLNRKTNICCLRGVWPDPVGTESSRRTRPSVERMNSAALGTLSDLPPKNLGKPFPKPGIDPQGPGPLHFSRGDAYSNRPGGGGPPPGPPGVTATSFKIVRYDFARFYHFKSWEPAFTKLPHGALDQAQLHVRTLFILTLAARGAIQQLKHSSQNPIPKTGLSCI